MDIIEENCSLCAANTQFAPDALREEIAVRLRIHSL